MIRAWTLPRVAGMRLRGRGFTLLELLVVMFIIGLLASWAVLAINPNTRSERLEREATRLWQLLSLAADEAVLQSRELGISFARGGYAFHYLHENEWRLVEADKRLRVRELPQGFEPEVEIDGLSIVLEDSPVAARPQVMMLSSGEIIPDFAIRLRDVETERAFRIGPGEETVVTLTRERE